MLTNSELRQIKDYLALYGKKDSQLTTVGTVENGDYVSVVQNGKNVIISIELLKRAVLEGIINDDEFNYLWDAIPTENSQNMVRSNGIWHAINDDNVIDTHQIINEAIVTSKIKDSNVTRVKLNDDVLREIEEFKVTLSASPTTLEITGSTLTSALTPRTAVAYYSNNNGDVVTPTSSSYSSTGGTIVGNTWTLPNTVGTYTATYTAAYNGVTKNASANVSTYLRKYFGFATAQPSDVTALGVSATGTTVNCTVTIPATNTGFNNIWFAVPNNMTINSITQPDSLNAPLAYQYVTTVTRTINGTNYTYKLYKSSDLIDSSANKRLTIS